jgi:hypothetical protein
MNGQPIALRKSLLQLQEEVAATLNLAPDLTGVQTLSVRKLDVYSEIAKAVNAYKGLFLAVSALTAKNITPGIRSVRLQVELVVTANELPTLNRSNLGTKLPGDEAIISVIERLHFFTPEVCAAPLTFNSMGLVDDPNVLMFAAKFDAIINLKSTATLA